jgi:hypothetical protein
MALAARLGPLGDAAGRQAERSRLMLDASLGAAEAGGAIDVVVHDISPHGFLAQTAAKLPVGSEVWLELTGVGRVSAKVRWRGSSTMGCEFETPISSESLAAAVAESKVIWPNFPANRSARPAPAVAPRSAPAADRQPVADDARWPFWGRALFILGSSIMLWSLLILAIRTAWAAIS